jgi:hypothetical protein
MVKNNENNVRFGMKITLQEKKCIQKLAQLFETNQKTAVMMAIEQALAKYAVKNTKDSILKDIESYIGVYEGRTDLSTNKEHLANFGKKNSLR